MIGRMWSVKVTDAVWLLAGVARVVAATSSVVEQTIKNRKLRIASSCFFMCSRVLPR